MKKTLEFVAGHGRRMLRGRGLAALIISGSMVFVPLIAGPVVQGDLLNSYWPRYAHQAYGHGLIRSRALQTPAGRGWIAAAEDALLAPAAIELPLAVDIAALGGQDRSLGYRFEVPAGRRLRVQIDLPAETDLPLFVDLFGGDGRDVTYLASATDAGRPGSYTLDWPVIDDSELLLRLQPELAVEGEVSISAAVEALLAFPVRGHDTRAIQSGFGAERDGGRRAHRGVDIFAERGTEALAAIDAWVSRVDTTPRGGNVVWLQSMFGNLRLYYAHLDSQLVNEGDLVLAGDVVGTVGNTGNAITTPPHLHFGVYQRRRGMRGGARDPYGFLR